MICSSRLFKGVILTLGLAGLLLAGAGCTTVEGTGRRQLMLVSEGEELRLGLAVWDGQVAQLPASADAASKAIIERVSNRLVHFTNRADSFDWRVKLVESDQVNAFCLPGGKMVVYTGILPVMENEAGMAAVLGHEMAHAVARHAAERISQAKAINFTARLAGSALGEYAPQWESLGTQLFGVGTTLGVALPFSREHESEADYLGLVYMAKAGYDPEEAVRLWERMGEAAKKRGKVPEFLSTHPSEDKRATRLTEKLIEARAFYLAAPERFGSGETLPGAKAPRTLVQVQ